jgi:hypothetical protein
MGCYNVAHNRQHDYHDSLHSAEVAQLTYRLVILSLAKRLKDSILSNVHVLWFTARRSPYSFSQHFPSRKIFTLRFHRCESHILQRPPLMPRLGDKPTPSPKSKKSHPVLLPRISAKLENNMLLN